MRARIWTAILIASLGFGTGGVATRAALGEGAPPYAIALFRALIATGAVVLFLAIRRQRVSRRREVWTVGLVAGLANLAVPFILFTLAYQHASAGFIGLLAALIPLGTAGLAHVLLPDEPLDAGKVTGLVVALVGVAVLLLSGDSGLADGGRPLLAFVLSLGAVAAISFAGVYAKRHTGTYEPIDVTAIQFASGAIVIAAAMAVVEGAPQDLTAAAWGYIGYMALASTFLPFALFYWLLRRVTVTYASIIGYVVPLIAVVTGIVLLGEELQPGIGLGGALIIVGVVLTDRAEQRSHQPLPPDSVPHAQ